MSTRFKLKRFSGVLVLCAVVLCLGNVYATDAASTHTVHRKKIKKPELPPLPSGPTGRPVPQLPLDSIKPVAPEVSFEHGELTINATNSTLGDILRAVHKETGAEIEIPDAQDRVVTHLGPGPARAVVAELLNGSRFNYVLLGSPQDPNLLTRVVLVAKSGPDNPPAGGAQAAKAANPPQETPQDASDADTSDDSNNMIDENADQPAAEVDQPQPEQPGVKTPQQMLQEMQQRQMQFQQQQQQQGGQPQSPGPGMPRLPQTPPDQ
ncbi:MAG TPA: hypothetical protein VMD99_02045 [Terriglobales bacterium]|nr:hypothetical protein [Terriglobales bacterium]